MGPLAGRLTDKVGARPLLSLELVIVSGAILIQSGITVRTQLPASAAWLHADGHRDRPGDVPDEHSGDELRRPDKGRGLPAQPVAPIADPNASGEAAASEVAA